MGPHPLLGVTENMSRGDVLVLLAAEQPAAELPCAGDPVIMEIDLPANHMFGRKCMQCQTTVVRVHKADSGVTRLAMRIHKMRFQSCAESFHLDEKAAAAVRQLLM